MADKIAELTQRLADKERSLSLVEQERDEAVQSLSVEVAHRVSAESLIKEIFQRSYNFDGQSRGILQKEINNYFNKYQSLYATQALPLIQSDAATCSAETELALYKSRCKNLREESAFARKQTAETRDRCEHLEDEISRQEGGLKEILQSLVAEKTKRISAEALLKEIFRHFPIVGWHFKLPS